MAQVGAREIETFRRDGVVVVRNVLSPQWLERLANAVEDNIGSPGPSGKNHAEAGGAYFGDYVNWQRFPDFLRAADDGPLGAVAGALMGAETVQFFHEHVLVKEPGNGSATPWHQDMPYYCLDGEKTVSLWAPLDSVTRDVCPHFIAGSHRDKVTYVPRRFKTLQPLEGDVSRYAPFPDIDETRDAERILAFDLAPGDVLAFDFHTLHNAPANPGGTRRRAISFRFVGEDARYVERPHEVSPPFPQLGLRLAMNDPLPQDWFPVVWHR